MQFATTSVNVLILLLYAIPGYILIKTKAVKSESIPAFAKVLLYVCQPCLSVYSFQKVVFSAEIIKNMGIFVGLNLGLMLFILLVVYLAFRKQYEDNRYRVCTVATALGNVGFLGVPLLEALLPEYPETIAYSAVFIVTMNILSWTVASFILTGDRRHVSVKKVFLNPQVLSLVVSLPLFFTKTALPQVLFNSVELLGKMTTPLCMLIAGMRFATADPKALFTDWRIYFTAAVKLVCMPLIGFLLTNWLPIEYPLKAAMVILCCCPTASVVLNLSEIYGNGQEIAANIVLTSTLFSMATIPLVLLIL